MGKLQFSVDPLCYALVEQYNKKRFGLLFTTIGSYNYDTMLRLPRRLQG